MGSSICELMLINTEAFQQYNPLVETKYQCDSERAFFAHHPILPITITKIDRGRPTKATLFGIFCKDASREEALLHALIAVKETGANRIDINGMS